MLHHLVGREVEAPLHRAVPAELLHPTAGALALGERPLPFEVAGPQQTAVLEQVLHEPGACPGPPLVDDLAVHVDEHRASQFEG